MGEKRFFIISFTVSKYSIVKLKKWTAAHFSRNNNKVKIRFLEEHFFARD